MKLIPLTRGLFAMVDDDVYEWASKFKWCALKGQNTYYAVRRASLPGGKGRYVYLHREILNAPAGVDVDHKDGNGLNDLGENIRLCTVSENAVNSRNRRDNTSGFRGVFFYALTGRWQAYITSEGKRSYLGYFDTALEAAQARDRAATELHGEFARLNFPVKPLA